MNIRTVTQNNIVNVTHHIITTAEIPVVIPVFKYTNVHVVKNPVIALFIRLHDIIYEVGMGHPDLPNIGTSILDAITRAVVPHVAEWLYVTPHTDGTWIDWAYRFRIHHEAIFHPLLLKVPEARRYDAALVPIDMIRTHYSAILESHTNDLQLSWFDTAVCPTLHAIEKNGMYVQRPCVFSPVHVVGHYVHGKFNPYNKTGRCTNTFNHVNFSALNKKDGSRDHIKSRFCDNGMLLDIDFESFHLRLISRIIGYTEPEESFHLHLAQQYFQCDASDVTEELYSEAKRISFRIMYNGEFDNFLEIPFFKHIHDFLLAIENGHATFPDTDLAITYNPEDSVFKRFNYFMQNIEASETLRMLVALQGVITTKQYESKIILYTYDSFTLDVSMADGERFIEDIITCLTYPFKMKRGVDYGHLM